MSWCTYMIAVVVTYVAWVWGCQVQNLTGASLDLSLFVFLVALWVYLLSYPFLGLIVMVLFEQYFGSGIEDPELRGYMNSFFAALFMGCITYFMLDFLSKIVVSAMDVALFCYAVEKDLGQHQKDRFAGLYDSIKMGVATGVDPRSSGVVTGSAVGDPQANSQVPAAPVSSSAVVGQPVQNEVQP